MIRYSWILLLLISCSSMAEQHDRYPFANQQQAQRFQSLLLNLRCLVCQNQNLADSHAKLANDLRDKVYLMLQKKKTDKEIMTFMTDRYGDFILFKPPLNASTYILWFAPFVLLLLALLVIFLIQRLGQRRPEC